MRCAPGFIERYTALLCCGRRRVDVFSVAAIRLGPDACAAWPGRNAVFRRWIWCCVAAQVAAAISGVRLKGSDSSVPLRRGHRELQRAQPKTANTCVDASCARTKEGLKVFRTCFRYGQVEPRCSTLHAARGVTSSAICIRVLRHLRLRRSIALADTLRRTVETAQHHRNVEAVAVLSMHGSLCGDRDKVRGDTERKEAGISNTSTQWRARTLPLLDRLESGEWDFRDFCRCQYLCIDSAFDII